MAETESIPFKQWAILELMGHRRLAGLVCEQEIAGKGFLRIDVPDGEGWAASQFYNPASVYCLTPVSETLARAVAKHSRPEPAHRWELPAPSTDARPGRSDSGAEGDGGDADRDEDLDEDDLPL